MQTELILLAGGSGRRMSAVVADKVLASLRGRTVFGRSLRAFVRSGCLARLIVVARDDAQGEQLMRLCEEEAPGICRSFTRGGAERADSVRAGLELLSPEARLVALHDAARPLVRPEAIRMVIEAAAADGAAVLAHRVVDTIKRLHAEVAAPTLGRLEDLERAGLWAMETPQVFRRDWLLEGYARARGTITDDAAAVAALDRPIRVVENPWANPKMTRPEDLAWAEFLLQRAAL